MLSRDKSRKVVIGQVVSSKTTARGQRWGLWADEEGRCWAVTDREMCESVACWGQDRKVISKIPKCHIVYLTRRLEMLRTTDLCCDPNSELR